MRENGMSAETATSPPGRTAHLRLIVVGALCAAVGYAAASTPEEDGSIVRGITISTHGGGQDWGQDVMAPTVRDIKTLGANWIATHPYGSIASDGSVGGRRGSENGTVPNHWTRPIAEAHAQGLKVCIKPHLAYWRSGFSWRGEIAFESDEAWARFWRDYSIWILELATACADADAFVIGTELDKTLEHEEQWRALIAKVREVYDGPITYAANWSDYKRVPFWDALDVIGIQAYFPITEEESPTATDIKAGWQRVVAELREYSLTQNRNVVFTELGYNQSYIAASEPWNYRVDDEGARAIQELCWLSALDAIASEPRIVGALLWKWFPHPRPFGRNFQLATPPIMRIISDAWQGEVPIIEFSQADYERWREERGRRRRQRRE
jgi:hypothetical protein